MTGERNSKRRIATSTVVLWIVATVGSCSMASIEAWAPGGDLRPQHPPHHTSGAAFGSSTTSSPRRQSPGTIMTTASPSSLPMLPSALAGSIAGAVGVGVAFPLDTIKTKQQTQYKNLETKKPSSSSSTRTRLENHSDIEYNADGTMIFRVSSSVKEESMWDVARDMYHTQGIGGFYAGVRSSMMGQAVIKSVAFCVNASVLAHLSNDTTTTTTTTSMDASTALLVAAATAGFVTAFLSTPMDRIKVLMQCRDGTGSTSTAMTMPTTAAVATMDDTTKRDSMSTKTILEEDDVGIPTANMFDETCGLDDEGDYCSADVSDVDCLRQVVQNEGLQGLLFRGLGATMCRDVPAYTIYFATYGYLMAHYHEWMAATHMWVDAAGSNSSPPSLWFGAIAGSLCVLPMYPVDVVKTIVQSSTGEDDELSTSYVIQKLWQTQGMAGFWDGLTPRLLRSAVNHAVTFATYDALLQL